MIYRYIEQKEYFELFCEYIKWGNVRNVKEELDKNPFLKSMINDLYKDGEHYYYPIQLAMKSRSKKIIDILIEYGAKLNVDLCLAVNVDNTLNLDMIDYLLEKGFIIDSEGNNIPYELINTLDEFNYFIDKGLLINSITFRRYCSNHIKHFGNTSINQDIFIKYLENDLEYNMISQYPPLHCLVLDEELEMAKLLVDEGENINIQDDNDWIYGKELEGYTPLMLACAWHKENSIRFLIESGADVNFRNKRFDTMLHSIIYDKRLQKNNNLHNKYTIPLSEEKKIINIINFLFNSGAKIELRNKEGLNAIQYANECGLFEVEKHLRNLSENNVTIEGNEKCSNNITEISKHLKALKELLDLDIITEEEFNIKKKDLLNL